MHPVVKENQSKFLVDEGKRRECVAVYLACRSFQETERRTGVSSNSLSKWHGQPWWREIEAEIVAESAARFDVKLSALLEGSLEKLQERLTQGNIAITKDGEQVFVPVPAKDLAVISKILFDKRQIIRNLPTAIKKNDDTLLKLLAEKLRKIPRTVDNGSYSIEDAEEIPTRLEAD